MSKFRQWIVGFFNIKAEDLRVNSEIVTLSIQIKERIQDEVSKQLEQKIQQSLREIVVPEIQKIISEQISQVIPQILASISPNEETFELCDICQSQPLEPTLQTPEPISIEEELINDNLPGDEIIEPQLVSTESISGNQEIKKFEQDQLELPDAHTVQTELSIQSEVISPIEEVIPLETTIPQATTIAPSIPFFLVTEKQIRIGIDFGTTTTAISVKIDDDRPEALPIGLDGITRFMPSIVYIRPGSKELPERAVVGEEAESYNDQPHIIRSIKRCFGCQGGNCNTNESGRKIISEFPFPWCQGDGKVHISDDETIQPSQIAYLIIRETLNRAVKVVRDRWHIELTRENVCFLPLNLGCGAKFTLMQREMICSIANDLGFQNIKIDNIVEEPILAGYTFSRFADQSEGRVLIYDFGGGTFDVAVLDVDRFQNNLRVTVIATAGENWLGGDDIDTLVYNHFLHEAAAEVGISVDEIENRLGSIDRSKLHLRARIAKEQLSSTKNYSDVLLAQNIGPINLDLTRDKFEEMLTSSGKIKKSLETVERACKLVYAYENAKEGQLINASAITRYSINDAARKIDRVILVGGVTKTPYIREKLIDIFGEKKIVQETVIDPLSAVAIGGAYPRESQHYSICVPPFGFYLEFEYTSKPGKHYQIVFEPYEYYDFHKFWMTGSVGVFFKDIDVQNDYRYVRICAKKVGGNEPIWCENLGSLSIGKWRFAISLEGDLYYSRVGESPIQIKEYPIVHPIQQAIRDARKYRQEQERKQRDESQGDYNDWIKNMMNEN